MHQMGSGMYVSGPAPDRKRERRLSSGSAATPPYTGGDVARSGELGRMFDISASQSQAPSPASSRRSSGPLHRPSPSLASGPLSQLSHPPGLLVGPSPSPLPVVGSSSSSSDGKVSVSFSGQVLGPKHRALSALRQSFPELGLTESEVAETSWLDATAQFAGLDTAADLPNRLLGSKQYSKGKSDYVRSPISRRAMAGIVRYLSTGPPRQGQGQGAGYVILDPYGGAMARIGSSDTPCPHRAGTLYGVQYQVYWDDDDHDLGGRAAAGESCMGWLRSLYAFMAPHVSKDPRAAYVNYLDLDLGTNNWTASVGGSSEAAVARARSSWGVAYFGDNFNRLVRAKTAVDPGNVFNNAQSIPPL